MLRSLINQQLGRYIIKELLGRGGMAAVYRATDISLQRDIALKILYPPYSDDAGLAERFKREAITAAALEHPYIVPVYDVGEQDGMVYIAMKLLAGQTLQDLLQQVGKLDLASLLPIIASLASALDYAHARGVVHRDIKPGNIFLSQQASGTQALLTDFGIAKQLDAPGLTTTGALIGTPDYMAPEQIAGQRISARTDVYALGMLVFRALTGRRAFEGSTQDVLVGHLYRQPPLPSSLAADVDPALDPVILQAVASDPADRYASAGAFVQALRQASQGLSAATAVGLPPALQANHLIDTQVNQPAQRTAVGQVSPPVALSREAQTQTPQPNSAVPATIGAATQVQERRPAGNPSSSLPWLVAIILALIVGGLGTALILRLSATDTNGSLGPAPASQVGLIETPSASPTQTLGLSPTLEATVALTATIATPSSTHEPTVEAQLPTAEPSAPQPSARPQAPLPSHTALPTPSVTALPSATPTVTATPTVPPTLSPTVTVTPIACNDEFMQGGFGAIYAEYLAVRTELGCPLQGEAAGRASEQFFERGTMYYWGLNQTEYRDTIFVFFGLDAGEYRVVSPEEAAALPPAPTVDDPNAPVRGFGIVYFGLNGVREALGRWTSPEIELNGSSSGVIQLFDRGLMLYTPNYQPTNGRGAIFVLYADGTFERYNDPLSP